MKIQYTYSRFPNCPRATEYSHDTESLWSFLDMVIGVLSFVAMILLFIKGLDFFEYYNWIDFGPYAAFAFFIGILNFYSFSIRPNNTKCELKVIVLEDTANLQLGELDEMCKLLRCETRKENKQEFLHFFPIYLLAFGAVIAVIGVIKGIYFLRNYEDGLTLLLFSIVALCFFLCIIWIVIKRPSLPKELFAKIKQKNKPIESNAFFCRKCGTKLLSNSVFCYKCGTKVR